MKNSLRSPIAQEPMAAQEKELLKYEAPQIHTYTQAEIFEMMGPAQGSTGDIDADESGDILGG